jgi:choice-of-anchor B domain-containing protein
LTALAAALALAAPPFVARAEAQSTFNTTLLAHILFVDIDSAATYANDVSGYTDPFTGNEYAIIGVNTGTGIFNVTDTDNVYRTGFIPGPNSEWRDFANYRNYLYAGSEGGGGIQIIDLANAEAPVLVGTYAGDGLASSHTITTDTLTARLYASGANVGAPGGPLGTYILSIADPVSPVHLGVYSDAYVHDTYARGDTVVFSAFAAGQQIIVDASDPADLDTLSFFTTELDAPHNSWPSEDFRYLYSTDEVTGGRVTTWDISDLSAPIQVDGYSANPTGDAHNIYINGDYGFVAHYKDGLRVLDVTDPTKMIEIGFYDTYIAAGGPPLFTGNWGAFPFTASGSVYLSDIESGLFIVSFEPKRGGVVSGVVTEEGTGVPLADVQLRISGSGQTRYTDAAGRYEFRTAEGSYTITAMRVGILPRTVPATVTAGTTTTNDFTALDNTAAIALSTLGPIVVDLRAGDSTSSPLTVYNTGGGLLQFVLRDESIVSTELPCKQASEGGAPEADSQAGWREMPEQIGRLLAGRESVLSSAGAEGPAGTNVERSPATHQPRASSAKSNRATPLSIPPLKKVLEDPVGDFVTLSPTPAGIVDATTIRAGVDSLEFGIQLETTADSIADGNLAIFFFDIDQNPSTGISNPITQDIGAERLLLWDIAGNFLPNPEGPIPGTAQLLLAEDPNVFYGEFLGEIDGGTATLAFDIGLVAEDGNTNFAGAVGVLNLTTRQAYRLDFLPNAGHLVGGVDVFDAEWLSSSPDSGSVVGGDSVTVQIEFDAPEIVADTTLEATIILTANLETNSTFEIPARLHVDGIAPGLTISLLQNPIFSSELEIVVFASEPLDTMPQLTLDGEAIALSGSFGASRPELRGSTTLEDSGSVTVMISGADLLGNTTSKTETFVAYKVPASGGIAAEGPEGAVRLEAAEGAIAPGTRLILRIDDVADGGEIDAGAIRGDALAEKGSAREPLSRRVSIGPAALALATPATITIPLDEDASPTDAAIFRLADGRWEALPTFVSADRRALVATTDKLGAFQARSGADAAPPILPAHAQLGLASPNPSSQGATIAFALARPGPASLVIFDLSGRRVRTLVDETRLAGPGAALWDGNDDRGRRVAAGTYLYRLETPEGAQARKITVLR